LPPGERLLGPNRRGGVGLRERPREPGHGPRPAPRRRAGALLRGPRRARRDRLHERAAADPGALRERGQHRRPGPRRGPGRRGRDLTYPGARPLLARLRRAPLLRCPRTPRLARRSLARLRPPTEAAVRCRRAGRTPRASPLLTTSAPR